MAVESPRPIDRPALRLALWAVMFACVFWTLLYRAGTRESGLPEFVYVNF